ncbi:hypothetical protein RhiLY_06247 [Ceratobasidium sp. AG-Ba]|nr:hypothetical protein RhiLY_06247 [Ceratobasidium sp. AG-Ba]
MEGSVRVKIRLFWVVPFYHCQGGPVVGPVPAEGLVSARYLFSAADEVFQERPYRATRPDVGSSVNFDQVRKAALDCTLNLPFGPVPVGSSDPRPIGVCREELGSGAALTSDGAGDSEACRCAASRAARIRAAPLSPIPNEGIFGLSSVCGVGWGHGFDLAPSPDAT